MPLVSDLIKSLEGPSKKKEVKQEKANSPEVPVPNHDSSNEDIEQDESAIAAEAAAKDASSDDTKKEDELPSLSRLQLTLEASTLGASTLGASDLGGFSSTLGTGTFDTMDGSYTDISEMGDSMVSNQMSLSAPVPAPKSPPPLTDFVPQWGLDAPEKARLAAEEAAKVTQVVATQKADEL